MCVCLCVCVNVCFHGSEKVILTARDHSLFVCMCVCVCTPFLKSTALCVFFRLRVFASTHVHP